LKTVRIVIDEKTGLSIETKEGRVKTYKETTEDALAQLFAKAEEFSAGVLPPCKYYAFSKEEGSKVPFASLLVLEKPASMLPLGGSHPPQIPIPDAICLFRVRKGVIEKMSVFATRGSLIPTSAVFKFPFEGTDEHGEVVSMRGTKVGDLRQLGGLRDTFFSQILSPSKIKMRNRDPQAFARLGTLQTFPTNLLERNEVGLRDLLASEEEALSAAK